VPDTRPILKRVIDDVIFTATDLAMDIGYARSSMGAVGRGEQAGRMTEAQRARLVAFLEGKREAIDALLLDL
jgi:hypothetical protein